MEIFLTESTIIVYGLNKNEFQFIKHHLGIFNANWLRHTALCVNGERMPVSAQQIPTTSPLVITFWSSRDNKKFHLSGVLWRKKYCRNLAWIIHSFYLWLFLGGFPLKSNGFIYFILLDKLFQKYRKYPFQMQSMWSKIELYNLL